MRMCRRSANVSRRRRPISSQTDGGQRLRGDHQRVQRHEPRAARRAGSRCSPRWRAPPSRRGRSRGRSRARLAAGRSRGCARRSRRRAPRPAPRARARASADARRRSAGCRWRRGPAWPARSPRPPPSTAARAPPRARSAAAPPPPARARGRAAPRCGPARSCRRARSRRRCPRARPPGPPRRSTRASHAAPRPRPAARAGGRSRWTRAGTAPSTSRRCGPDAPKPAISRSTIAIRSAGIDLVQVVRGPQPGVAGAHDRDVGLDVAGEGWPGRQVDACGVVPERVLERHEARNLHVRGSRLG